MISKSYKNILLGSAGAATAIFALLQSLVFFNILDAKIFSISGFFIGIVASLLFGLIYARTLNRSSNQVVFCLFDELLIYLPYFIALEKGYFRKNGLSVSHIIGGGDLNTWKTVDSGKAQFGISDPSIFLKNGSDTGRLLSVIVNKAAFWGVSKKNISLIKSAEEFSDFTTLASYESPSTNFKYSNLIAKASNINKINFQPGNEIEFVTKNENILTLLPEPFVSECERKNFSTLFSGPKTFGEIAYTGVYAKTDFIKNNQKTVKNIVLSLQQALNLIHQHPLEALAIADKAFPAFDRIVLYKAVLRMLDEEIFPKSSAPNISSWTALTQLWGIAKNKCHYRNAVQADYAEKAFQQTSNESAK